MFLLYSSTITSNEIFAAIGLLSLSMVYMKFCNICNKWQHNAVSAHHFTKTIKQYQGAQQLCTYCVDLVVFMFCVDVFDVCYNVCVQSLKREKHCLHESKKDCPIGRSAEALTAENQVHRSKLLTHHYIRHSPVSKIKLTGHFVRYTEWIARLL